MSKNTVIAACIAVFATFAAPRAALPCGPGVHIVESDNIWAMLVEEYPRFEYLEDTPMFGTWLHVGSTLPDFQNFLPTKQGHSSVFSVNLIKKVIEEEQDDRFLLIALGHLMHTSVSDPLCEQFWTPTVMASFPLGNISILESSSDAKGIAEGLTEILGDPLVGDYDAVIDMAYDIYFDGDEARARGHETVVWYVNELNEFYGSDTNPEFVWQTLVDMIADYEIYVLGLDRDGAKDFFGELVGDTPDDLINFLTGDLFMGAVGDTMVPTENYDIGLRFIKESPLMENPFWDLYGNTLLKDLSAYWYVDRVDEFAQTLTAGNTSLIALKWPTCSTYPMVSGNIMSTMQFLPDVYDVVPGFIVDDAYWTDGDGTRVTRIDTENITDTFTLTIVYYSAFDFVGDITLKIKGDLPGFNQESDPVLATDTVDFVTDPRTCVSGERSTMTLQFTPGAAPVDGYYFEIYINDLTGPAFTSNWDTIMSGGTVPVDQVTYRDVFATYGKWPPSLAMTGELKPDDCEFMVHARTFPSGGPLVETSITLKAVSGPEILPEDTIRDTKTNGIAVFDKIEPGTWNITSGKVNGAVAADGEPTEVVCESGSGTTHWIDREYHVVPRVWLDGGISARNDCVVFNTNIKDYWGKADNFMVTVTDFFDDTVLMPETRKSARARMEACFTEEVENGTTVKIRLVPEYVDDFGMGVEGFSDPILIDSTAPIIESIAFVPTSDICGGSNKVYAFNVDLRVNFGPASVDKLEWTDGDGEWAELEYESVDTEDETTIILTTTFDPLHFAPGDSMIFRVTTQTGKTTEEPTTVPEDLACPTVVEPTADVIDDVTADATVNDRVADSEGDDTTTADTTGTDAGGGGCSAGNMNSSGGAMLATILLMAYALIIARRKNSLND